MPINVLISAESPFVRECLQLAIDSTPDLYCVGAFPESEASAYIANRNPQVVLHHLSELEKCTDCLPFIRNASSHPNPVPVALITSCEIPEHHHEALQAGAAGILAKTITVNDLVHSVHLLSNGGVTFWPASVWTALEARIRHPQPDDHTPLAVETLTPRELDVLLLIGEGHGNEQIANLLHLEFSTVKDHVSAILAKLGAANRTQAAIIAARSGYSRPDLQSLHTGIPRQRR
ncbi:LuxR C-terminal-related transcriptional regulator [Kitasatospora sp. NPDC089509]|uniref:response regulator transcription factor n=1 Tax=Kitasatospora sp. NPDC089509 TaxID=3364079 RepID=UPI0037FD1CA3